MEGSGIYYIYNEVSDTLWLIDRPTGLANIVSALSDWKEITMTELELLWARMGQLEILMQAPINLCSLLSSLAPNRSPQAKETKAPADFRPDGMLLAPSGTRRREISLWFLNIMTWTTLPTLREISIIRSG